MKRFKPEDNPLRDVKVKMEEDLDPERMIYVLTYGTDKGYKVNRKTSEKLETRQKRENRLDF